MKYILDTNTLSFLMKGDPSVSRELLLRSRTDVLLPQPVVDQAIDFWKRGSKDSLVNSTARPDCADKQTDRKILKVRLHRR